jgi:hypothetical protein
VPTNSISGSLGKAGAGATVFLTQNITGGGGGGYAGLWPELAETVADASGNYMFSGLTSNPFDYLGDPTNGSVVGYRVTPAGFGSEFAPFSSDQVLSGVNITGVNFTKNRTYTLVHEYSADFSGSQNPLTNWTQIADDPTGLQSVSGQCQALGDAAASTSPSGAYPSAYTPSSADCYSKSTFAALNDADFMGASLRTDDNADTVGFGIEYYGLLGTPNDGGFQLLDNSVNFPMFTGLGFLNGTFPHTLQVGDAVIFIARGANFYIFLNPAASPTTFTPLAAGSSAAASTSNFVAVQMDIATADHTTSALSAFSAGRVQSAPFSSGGDSSSVAGYGTDLSAGSEVTTNPAAETNSNRTAIMGTNRGSRFIG